MKHIISGCAAAALLVASACSARAQSDDDIAGWVALMITPIGALTPKAPALAGDTSAYRLHLRYGHWQFASSDGNTHDVGAGIGFRRGRTRTTIELGYIHNTSCDNCDSFMAGADVDIPVVETSGSGGAGFRMALNPAVGYAHPNDGTGSALSAALSVLASASFKAGTSALIVPFVSPGIGHGHVSASGSSAGGTRNILGGGVTIASARSFSGVTISAHKVFIQDAPTVYGIGFSVAR
jgi:opacity protein-like surface antigen